MLLNSSGTGHATETIDSPGEHGWDLHWRYDCGGGNGVFAADVFESDHTPDFAHPGIYEEGGGGDAGVYHVPGEGPVLPRDHDHVCMDGESSRCELGQTSTTTGFDQTRAQSLP